MDIHIFWEGPFKFEDLVSIKEGEDYGVYQVYGQHPLYGNSVLLYIGQANKQTFGVRLGQEEWWLEERDPKNIEFYLGRFAGQKSVSDEEWEKRIDQAEKLLIYAHQPVYNISNTNSIPEEYVSNSHIFNWGSHRDLFPEVSGKRYTSKYDHISEDNIYA